jgi:4-hydroxy-tetrahydrodipicolinate reductase
VPVVVGTTGWLERLPEVKERLGADGGTLLHASNFSIGVNLFFELNKMLARLMDRHPEYSSIHIHESHHVHKLDAPSGTAISIAEQMTALLDRFERWRSIPFEARTASDFEGDSIPVYHTREDEVPGTHSVHYASPVDAIEIRHTAYSREGFARGALAAAHWLAGKKGYYTIEDFLKQDKKD